MVFPLLMLSISKLCFLLSILHSKGLWFLKTMQLHTKETYSVFLKVRLLRGLTFELQVCKSWSKFPFPESIRSTVGFFKPSSTFTNEQYTLYFINTQLLCWLTLQKWSGWETSPKNILILLFTFFFLPKLHTILRICQIASCQPFYSGHIIPLFCQNDKKSVVGFRIC